jgi:mRNA interferase RelE/StbE
LFYARTNYEIAYRIYEEENKLVVVVLAGTRENFHEQLKRYMKER